MLGIVEGIDKTGKSTLVSAIARELGTKNVDIRHASKPKVHPLEEYETSLGDYEPGTVSHVLLDRWHLGETVWPTIFNRPTEYDREMHRHVELFLVSRGALLILAEARETPLVDRIDEGDFFSTSQVPDILLAFKTSARTSLLTRMYYDFERDDVRDFAIGAIQAAFELESAVSRVHNLTSFWLGYPVPNVLYVGERPSPQEQPQVAPFTPYRNAAGHALMQALPDEPHALINAYRADGTREPLNEIWVTMNRPRVVALGNEADQALLDLNVLHGVAPHPQFVRRFHSIRIADGTYTDMLERAAWGVDTRGEL
jgi:hypothetical protein